MAGEPMLVVVEDDDVFAKVLINNLAGAGFAATHFDGPETAMVGVPAMERCDLLVLDWRLPGMTGVDLLDMLRKAGNKAPALLLTPAARFVDLDGPLLIGRDRTPALAYRGGWIDPPPPELWG